ncbi:MAG: DUF1059 domain-containing protein [Candidatus ainarchaeum sp.]|nr:DUF1059 domain-containing protein [Candidatus ainarchaeum sp.]
MDVKKISCDPMCGFAVQSHDEKELLAIVGSHVKKIHNKAVSASELKGMMQTVSA